jgi:beta-glucosidase
VKNIGKVSGDEVVQVYVSSNNKDEDRPVKLLKGFKRVSVEAGETVRAEIEVSVDDIKFFDPESSEWKVDESYTVLIGTDSRNAKPIGEISF